MSNSKAKPRLKMFRHSSVSEDFFDDLETFLNLEDEPRQKLLEFYIKRKTPLTSLKDREVEGLVKQTSLSKENIEDVGGLIRFLLRQIAIQEIILDDIVKDIENLDYEKKKIEALRSFLKDVLGSHPNVEQSARKTLSANSVVNNVESLGFSIDVRAVYDANETLTDVVPVLLVRMVLAGLEKKRELIFQLSEEKLDQFCEMLTKQKTKLKEISDRVCLEKGNKE